MNRTSEREFPPNTNAHTFAIPVLEAVNWRVHPTMAAAIIPYFFLLLPEPSRTPAEQDGSVYEQETIEMDADLPQIMSDYAIFLTELGETTAVSQKATQL